MGQVQNTHTHARTHTSQMTPFVRGSGLCRGRGRGEAGEEEEGKEKERKDEEEEV